MRIIAGTAKGLPLKTIKGMDTRPTTDRIKETLFNMIQGDVPGSVFLDLFAGSGGIGLEALSRGAKSAVFVERSGKAAACIEDNIRFAGFAARASVLRKDALVALETLEGTQVFDIVFLDPPYHKGLEQGVLSYLSSSQLLCPGGLAIVEAAEGTSFGYLAQLSFDIRKVKNYKTNLHLFLVKR